MQQETKQLDLCNKMQHDLWEMLFYYSQRRTNRIKHPLVCNACPNITVSQCYNC